MRFQPILNTIFSKFSGGACLRTPLEGLKHFFSPPRGSKIFFWERLPPKQKILDRTLAIHLSGCGRYRPQQFHCRVLVEVHWKPRRICILRYLILGLILPNNRWIVMHFFMCIVVQSHRKIPKVQSFQFSSFLSGKNVHVL